MVGHKIILAGVDGSGKTTLAKKIQADYPEMNYKIVHSTKETPNDLKYFSDFIDSGENIIFDRFYVDQFVYQNAEDRKRNGWLNLFELAVVEEKIKAYNCRCIFVNTDLNTCLVNCLKDTEDYNFSLDYVEQLYNNYKYFINNISTVNWEIYTNNFTQNH